MFVVEEVLQLLRSYYNSWSLLNHVAPPPQEFRESYSYRLAGESSLSYQSRSQRSLVPSQSVHGEARHATLGGSYQSVQGGFRQHTPGSRPPFFRKTRSVIREESPVEGVDDTEQAKRSRFDRDPPLQS